MYTLVLHADGCLKIEEMCEDLLGINNEHSDLQQHLIHGIHGKSHSTAALIVW